MGELPSGAQNGQTVSKGKLLAVAIGAFLLMFSSAVVSNSTSYFVSSVTEAIGCTRAQFSLYYSILQIATSVVSLFIGVFYLKLSMRKLFLIGSIGTTIGFIIMSTLNSLWMVYAGALVIGAFQVLIVVPPVKVVNSWFRKGNGTVMGFVMAATGFGGIMMAQIMPRVVAYVSWRTGYLVCAALYFAITLVALTLCGGKAPEYEEEHAGPAANALKGSAGYKSVLKSVPFWILLLACFLHNGFSSGMAQHLSAHLEAQSMSVGMIASVMSIWSLALALLKIGEGWLYEKLGSKIFIPLFFLVGSFGYLALTMSSTGGLIIGVIMYALQAALVTVAYPLVARELFGQDMASAVWGICWASFQAGVAVIVPIYGSTFDNNGSYNPILPVATAAIFAIGIAFTLVLRRNRKKTAAARTNA